MRRKSPQEKKALEYAKDHFTFGRQSSRMFPKTWKVKKAQVNRQYRRKSQNVLADLRPGIGEADLMSEDLTAARFQKSISRKRLYKHGTVTLGEKVKVKMEKRAATVGRRNQLKERSDRRAMSAITTLDGLQDEELARAARRAETLCSGNAQELRRVMSSQDPVDRALEFLYRICFGSAHEIYALWRNPELQHRLGIWLNKPEKVTARSREVKQDRPSKAARVRRGLN